MSVGVTSGCLVGSAGGYLYARREFGGLRSLIVGSALRGIRVPSEKWCTCVLVLPKEASANVSS